MSSVVGKDYEDLSIGRLMNRVTRTHMENVHNSFEKYGVQKTFGPLLFRLSSAEGITQNELAGAMQVSPPSICVNIKKMESEGLLVRNSDEDDMRLIRLYLTDEGREVAEKSGREVALADDKLVKTLTSDEKQELKRILIKILKNQEKEG